jgi:ferredoxin-NADP reductase
MSVPASTPVYRVTLLGRFEVAERTMAFWFEKPPGFSFKAGQFVDVTLVNPPESDGEGDTRAFSLASAPHEDRLMVATRLRDTAFKRVLKAMDPGAAVHLEGPFGNLTLPTDSTRPTVLIAGGIGITPFRSMLLHRAHEGFPAPVCLVYSNRRPEDAPFLDELQDLQKSSPNYTFIGTMTAMEKSGRTWHGHAGKLDRDFLLKIVSGLKAPLCYVAGPPGMVHGIQTMLREAAIPPKDIHTEDFAGY